MSDDKYIRLVEAFQSEGYTYEQACKLAYEAFKEGDYEKDKDK
jgi:hypothetical protein